MQAVPENTLWLGKDCVTPYPRREVFLRLLRTLVWAMLFRWSPRPLHGFRKMLLRLFGARINGPVVIFPTARVTFPWKLALEPRSMVGPHVLLYNLAAVRLEHGANVSQHPHLSAGSHDFSRWSMPLVTGPIAIGRNVWPGADVFVGPGVRFGELSVVGARSVAVENLPVGKICVGSPCRAVRDRSQPA